MRRLVPFLLAAIVAASFPTSFLVILIGPLIISTTTTTNSGSGDGCVADGISCFKSGHHHGGSSGGFGVGGLTGVAATSAVMGRSSRSSSSSMTSTAVTTAVFMASSTGGGRWQGVAAESNAADASAAASNSSSDAVAQSPTKPAVHTSLETYDEKQRLAVQVLGPGGGPHCAFSLVEFTNSVSLFLCFIILL